MKRIFLIVLCIIFSSCDYYYSYEYIVQNDSSSQITVELFAQYHPILDTVYRIESNQSLQIYETIHGNEGAGGPFFDDVSKDLTRLVIKKNDTLISNRDFIQNSNWLFTEGMYLTIITDIEFE